MRRVKTVSTRRTVKVGVKKAMRGEFFIGLVLVCGRLIKSMGGPFSFDEGAYKGRNVGVWEIEKAGGRIRGLRAIDSVIAWDALMTTEPKRR